MKRVVGRIVGYTLLYCGVIFALFVLQFTKGQSFSVPLGAMVVTGRQEYTKTGVGVPLLPLHVVSSGLDIYISDQDAVYAVDEAGRSGPLSVLSYQFHETDGRFSVHCSNDVVLSFFSEKRGEVENFTVKAVMPDGIKKIAIPWKLTYDAGVERTNGKIFVRFADKRYAFVGRFGLDTDTDTPEQPAKLRVVLEKAQPVASYKTHVSPDVFDVTAIPSMPYASADSYEEALKTFSDAVLHAGAQALSAKKHTEQTLTAYVAEMGRSGKFAEALTDAPARTLPKSGRTYLSNPFYGSVRETHAGLAAADANKRKRYEELIADSSPAFFEHDDVVPFLTDRASVRSREGLFRMIETVEPSSLTVRQAAGLLAVFLDCERYYPERTVLFEALLPHCEKRITESLLLVDGGLYISNEGSYIDTLDSLAIARVLARYGVEHSSMWQSVARMMVTSLLQYSGASAGLPVGFTVEGSKTTQPEITADDSGMLDAGVLYPLLMPDNSWYPHAQSLATQAEPGMWAWTCAQSIEVEKMTVQSLVLRIRFPKEQTHYITLHGIKPFYRIEMYGVPFRSDPRFEMYNSAGYAYDSESGVLYIKMKHKSEYEIIHLSLGSPPYQPQEESSELPKAADNTTSSDAARAVEPDTAGLRDEDSSLRPDLQPEKDNSGSTSDDTI